MRFWKKLFGVKETPKADLIEEELHVAAGDVLSDKWKS
jgi:hypothetical protein